MVDSPLGGATRSLSYHACISASLCTSAPKSVLTLLGLGLGLGVGVGLG